MFSYKWQLRIDAWFWFFKNWTKDLLKNLIRWWPREGTEISEIAAKSSSIEDYLRRLTEVYNKSPQKASLKLLVYFSELFLVATYEICLPEKTPLLKGLKPVLEKKEVGDLLWYLQGKLIGKEIYPFGREFPSLRNFVIGVRNVMLYGGLEKFHDAKLMYDVIKECCLVFGIPAAIVHELWNAVDEVIAESIPFVERRVTFKKIDEFAKAVAAREP